MWDSVVEYLLIPGQQMTHLLVSLIMAVLLGSCIAVVYRVTHRNMNYEPAILTTIIAIAPIVTMIMFFIQGNLVLSLGLVGSLSIIRFRTPIKDSRDMVFLFWSIGAGLGCGTYNWTITIAATLVISLVIAVLFLIRYKQPINGEFIIVIKGEGAGQASAIEKVLTEYKLYARVRSHQIENEKWETIYELRSSGDSQALLDNLAGRLSEIEGVSKVSLLAPQLALPV